MAETNRHIRFEALHSALSYALQKTLSKITLKAFVSCYPQIDVSSLEYVRKQVVSSWQSKAESEFQKIFMERQLQLHLNELDKVIEKAEQRKCNGEKVQIDVSDLSPTELVKAHMITMKREVVKNPDEQLSALRESNEKLQKRLNEYKLDKTLDMHEYPKLLDDLKIIDELDEQEEDSKLKSIVEWAVDEMQFS